MLLFLALTLSLNTNIVLAATENQTNLTNTSSATTAINSSENLNLTSNTTSSRSNTSANGTVANSTATNSDQLNNHSTDTSNYAAGSLAAGTSTIKVLIYNGIYTSFNCVNGLKTALDYANTHHLIPGVTFSYATSTVINSAVLAGYNLLAMPGGDGGSLYLGSSSISATAIKNFVSAGGGYLGICAGAYAGSAHVDGRYDGWGVAPHVNAKAVAFEGLLPMQFTSAGQQMLGRSGALNISHYNGAAMYVTGGNAVTLATYADSSTGYKNYADIVGDYYGNGRSVLIGSHPELSPQYPDIIANLIVWATKTGENPTSTVTSDQIANAASSVKNFYATNKRLPNYVTIANQQITMPQLLYLLATGTSQINSGSTAPIPIKNVNPATTPTENIKSGNIQKSEYVTLAQNLKTFIGTNGQLPNYLNTSLGKMKFESALYMFSKILDFYNTNHRLPSYIAVSAWAGTTQSGNSSSEDGNTAPQGDQDITLSVSQAQLNGAVSGVKSFIERYNRMPNYVTVANQQISIPQFLNLLAKGLLNINSNKTSNLTTRNIKSATTPTENITSGNIQKTEYVNLAQSLNNFITGSGQLPNYLNTSLGKMSAESALYMLIKVFDFYNINHRLPSYVSVSAWTGPTSNTGTGNGTSSLLRPVYILSDNINSVTQDNARINNLISELAKLRVVAYNYGVGASNIGVLQDSNVPQNALVVEIAGGACAGTINEMGTAWYKNIKGSREVFIAFTDGATKITGLEWLPRAHDDNFDPPTFTGLAHPDEYLLNNGYHYYEGLVNSKISELAQILYSEATS